MYKRWKKIELCFVIVIVSLVINCQRIDSVFPENLTDNYNNTFGTTEESEKVTETNIFSGEKAIKNVTDFYTSITFEEEFEERTEEGSTEESKTYENENTDYPLSNSTFYTLDNDNDDTKDFDFPIMESETLKRLTFPHSLQAIQEALKKIPNTECVNDTAYVLRGISKKEKWALELLDSFPKFPESILNSNFYQLGNFDECVGVRSTPKDVKNQTISQNIITGQYCLAEINFKRKFESRLNLQKRATENKALKKHRELFDTNVIHWAVCIPSSCKTEDTEIFMREILLSAVKHFEIVSVNIDPKNCETEKSLPVTTGEIVYGTIVGIFLIFTILATVVHLWHLRHIRKSAMYNVDDLREKHTSLIKETVICFSVINTTERFFHTTPNDLNLESICGVKFISMVTIVAGHSLIFFFGGPIVNTNFFLEVSTKVEHAIFINSPIIVDTFLLISGFLMCRLLLIEMDKRKGKINFIFLYIARYVRLTPAYAVVIGLYSTFLYRMGSGPFWESRIGLEKDRCENSWWLNLLYINNYVGTDNLCMFQSWYLAVDFHLFIIAPFFIYFLWKKPKVGEILLIIWTAISIVLPFWITFNDQLDPTVMAYPPEVQDLALNFYFVNYYIKTHMRMGSYCIGIFYAYLVHRIQGSLMKIPAYVIFIGWTFAIMCGVASMFSIVIFYDPNHNVNIIENAIYAALHRVTWSLSIGWILLVCITDNAGYVNKFLSNKFFIPASRLTYCAYLANGLVEIYSAGITRQPMYMSIFELACKTCGHIVLTFVFAFILCIIFESPIHGMEKILLKTFDPKEKDKPRTSNFSARSEI